MMDGDEDERTGTYNCDCFRKQCRMALRPLGIIMSL